MDAKLLLYPLFVQVGLTFALLFCMGRARVRAVVAGEVKVSDISLGQRAWPARIQQLSNAYQNQFELPVLYYLLSVLLLLHPRAADPWMLALASAFVALRLVHAAIYATSNKIRWRFHAFLLGALVLLAMWVLFAVRTVLGSAA